jgi:hypothetical protein
VPVLTALPITYYYCSRGSNFGFLQEDWPTLHGGVGTNILSYYSTRATLVTGTPFAVDKYCFLRRYLVGYDVSSLAGKVIISASVSWTCPMKFDSIYANPDVGIYDASPTNPSAIDFSDYDKCGVTPYSSIINFFNIHDSTPNIFNLNAAGLAALAFAAQHSINFVFAFRNHNYDVVNNKPPWVGGNYGFEVEPGWTGGLTQLTVNYRSAFRKNIAYARSKEVVYGQ